MSLVVTLFILVVLASLGGYMARISTLQHSGTTLTLQSTRAWYMAVSGLDWLVDRINGGGCPAVPSSFSADGFTIEVTQCDSSTVTEGSDDYTLYNVTVRARHGAFGDADYVSRRISASFVGS